MASMALWLVWIVLVLVMNCLEKVCALVPYLTLACEMTLIVERGLCLRWIVWYWVYAKVWQLGPTY